MLSQTPKSASVSSRCTHAASESPSHRRRDPETGAGRVSDFYDSAFGFVDPQVSLSYSVHMDLSFFQVSRFFFLVPEFSFFLPLFHFSIFNSSCRICLIFLDVRTFSWIFIDFPRFHGLS